MPFDPNTLIGKTVSEAYSMIPENMNLERRNINSNHAYILRFYGNRVIAYVDSGDKIVKAELG